MFEYALLFHAYDAYGSFEECAKVADRVTAGQRRTGEWRGTARELRATLFFLQRAWRHGGYRPEGDSLAEILALFETIQRKVGDGDLAPNLLPEGHYSTADPLVLDGESARLLAWERREGAIVLTAAINASGEVVERACPPSVATVVESFASIREVAVKGILSSSISDAFSDGAFWPVEDVGKALLRHTLDRVEVAPLAYAWDGPDAVRKHFDERRIVGWVDAEVLATHHGKEELAALVRRAERARRGSYRLCAECGRSVAPEEREGGTCHSCMAEGGTVF